MGPMTILAERAEGVLEVALNRPDSLNAINHELVAGLSEQLDIAARDDDIRALLLRGKGRGFCAGGDIRLFTRTLETEGGIPKSLPDGLHVMIEKIRALPKPIVACVHGAAAGAGFSLMLSCDLVIAADTARFNLAYTAIGAAPDGSSSYFLPRHVGMKRATEMFMAPRSMKAEEALELGLINRIVPAAELLEQARQWARLLAAGPTYAYGRVKQLVNATWTNDLPTQLDLETDAIVTSSRTDDFREGITAFLAKRPPNFKGS